MPTRAQQKNSADLFVLGRIVGVFGVRGEVRIHLDNPASFLWDAARELEFVDASGTCVRARMRIRAGAGKRVLARIDAVEDRNEAERWVGRSFQIERDALPQLEEGEFWVADAVGAKVVADGVVCGTVKRVHSNTATDVFEIKGTDNKTYLIPSVIAFVAGLDADRGELLVHPDAMSEERCLDSTS